MEAEGISIDDLYAVPYRKLVSLQRRMVVTSPPKEAGIWQGKSPEKIQSQLDAVKRKVSGRVYDVFAWRLDSRFILTSSPRGRSNVGETQSRGDAYPARLLPSRQGMR